MSEIKKLNILDTRYLRYYIQFLHTRTNAEWGLDIINGYNQKVLKNTFDALINEYKEITPLMFEFTIQIMSEEAKKNLLDISEFDWTHSDRAMYFTWNALKNEPVDLNLSFKKDNTNTKKLECIINNKERIITPTARWRRQYSHLCCNTNNNISNYIIWTFDDAELDEMLASKIRGLDYYRALFRMACSENNTDWIKANDAVQLAWLYNYLIKKTDFSFIAKPTSDIQFYNTVICQLDLICSYYSKDLEVWDYFLKSVKKAWLTQSDRLKKRKIEIKLDKESIKMLQKIVGEDATDNMLKKKLKELIKVKYDAVVEKDT